MAKTLSWTPKRVHTAAALHAVKPSKQLQFKQKQASISVICNMLSPLTDQSSIYRPVNGFKSREETAFFNKLILCKSRENNKKREIVLD